MANRGVRNQDGAAGRWFFYLSTEPVAQRMFLDLQRGGSRDIKYLRWGMWAIFAAHHRLNALMWMVRRGWCPCDPLDGDAITDVTNDWLQAFFSLPRYRHKGGKALRAARARCENLWKDDRCTQPYH